MPADPGAQPEPDIIHATTVAHKGRAVLIRGASGSGKSGLALQLIALGAALVADDRTQLRREKHTLLADAPAPIRSQIEARGVGILAAPAAGPTPVTLVVDLDETETDRLPPARETRLLGLSVPLLRKIDAHHFPAAIMVYLEHGRIS